MIRRRKTDYAQEDGGEDVTFVPLLGRFAGGGDGNGGENGGGGVKGTGS